MKLKMQNLIKSIMFCIIFFFLFNLTSHILLNKTYDGINSMEHFYSQKKNSIDVIFLGPSVGGTCFNIESMWRDYGIAGYNLWGSGQPLWHTYYWLKEALKSQSPKLIVLDVSTCIYKNDVSTEWGLIHTLINTQGLHFSINYFKNIFASTHPERWGEVLFGITTFHERYKELTKYDFQQFLWNDYSNDKGNFSYLRNYIPLDMSDVSNITGEEKMFSKSEKYLNCIIDLCKNKNIPIILMANPTADRMTAQPFFNYVENIAHKKSVDFINTNLMNNELQLESADTRDGSHMTIKGAKKVSNYLGLYMHKKYKIPDRKGDSNYASWEENAHVMENKYLRAIDNIDDYFEHLGKIERNIYIVKYNLSDANEEFDILSDKFVKEGVSKDFFSRMNNQVYFIQKQNTTDDCVRINFDDSCQVIKAGNIVTSEKESGIICVVYDDYTEEIEDITFFPESNYNNIQHIIPEYTQPDVIRFNFEYKD